MAKAEAVHFGSISEIGGYAYLLCGGDVTVPGHMMLRW